MVRERTDARYKALAPEADPIVAEKVEVISMTRNNVAGIMHALEKDASGG
jgi:hypothetical protein